jgi:hypothetical protein
LKIFECLKGRNCTVFSGHTHNYLFQEVEGISLLTQATTGGGSGLRGSAYGEFDQVVWVTLTPEGPQIANLALDGILDTRFRTPPIAAERAAFSRNKAVQVEPVVLASATLTTATTVMRIDNPSSQPMRIKVLPEVPEGIQVSPGMIYEKIEGKTGITTTLHLRAEKPIPLEAMQPLVFQWSASYDSNDNTPSVKLGGETNLLIDSPFKLEKCGKAPTVDGKLDDWAALPYVVTQPAQIWPNANAWKGPWDSRYRFGITYDEQAVFVAIKTTDDEPCFDGWKYMEDFVVFMMDGKVKGELKENTSIFSLLLGPEMKPEQADEFIVGTTPEGLQAVSLPCEDGFVVEVAIPIGYLKQYQGEDWDRLRVNIGFGDFDRRDARDGATILFWRPQWKGAGDTQTGLFLRGK